MNRIRTLCLLVMALGVSAATARVSTEGMLAQRFADPPVSARPWVYWFWLNGNITRAGITADLEAMKQVGIGGVLIMEVDQGAPAGGVAFAGRRWRELFRHVVNEAHRLGLQVNMNNDAGWCGSGGPWVPPSLSMQKLVWTETHVSGPGRVAVSLPQPTAVAGFYRDIATLAVPDLKDQARLPGVGAKALFKAPATNLAMPAEWTAAEAGATIPRDRIFDVSRYVDREGKLVWRAPPGKWVVLRFGHTSTGARNHPSPESGRGFECDKLSRKAVEVHFAGLMGKLIRDAGPLAGKALVSTHIDSWEVGVQNWTARFREEFQRRRGYDLLPFLPTITGRVIDSREVSERFLWDFRKTISDLLLDNYAGYMRDLARRHGLRLSIEAYHTCPVNELAYAGRADEPMGEFWSWGKYGAAFSCTEMASAGHVYGKRIIGAEAFTASSGERWLGHPGNIKDLGDWAFCEGINRFVFHRYALQPWLTVAPGMSMGPWGLHYERTQTWWKQSTAWHKYLSRCQFLLQQGLFVADLCLLAPEGAPQSLVGQRLLSRGAGGGRPLVRSGYNFDVCPPEVVLKRMSVAGGRLVLPDGMSYRLLALPRAPRMTPQLLRRIKDLAAAGATIVGAPPVKSPSLSGYPTADREVRQLAVELWGGLRPPDRLTEHRFGKGRVFWGGDFGGESGNHGEPPPRLSSARWIWYPEGQPARSAPPGRRYFRRPFVVEPGWKIESARLVMTADNQFECRLNGRRVLSGSEWNRTYSATVTRLLRPGANLLTVAAENTTDAPTPAGLIGALLVRSGDGRTLTICTNDSWQAAKTAGKGWQSAADAGGDWVSAVVLGPNGMAPWGDVEQAATANAVFPDLDALGRLLARLGAPPDFAYQPAGTPGTVRYLHRTIRGTDVYFVANQNPRVEDLLCSFRVVGKRPELWWPRTGRIERPAVYDVTDQCTRIPLRLESHGSVFVVFQAGTAADSDRIVSVHRNGADVLETTWQPAPQPTRAPDDNAHLTNSFTMAVWARPTADTILPPEATTGVNGFTGPRNDALYPPPGHEVYSDPTHAGCGLSVGRNGVCVFEHSDDYFASVLTWAAPLTDWTHVTVVYRDGEPRLYLNGRFVHKGLQSGYTVHPGVGVKHNRPVTPFRGDLGPFRLVPRALSEGEIETLLRSMPRPRTRKDVGALRVLRRGDRGLEMTTDRAGKYVLLTARGRRREASVESVPDPLPLTGTWEVRFPRHAGGYKHLSFDALRSWSTNSDPEVRYFSGTADYWKAFTVPARLVKPSRRFVLDLGKVAVVAQVSVNEREFGVLWKAPFRVDVTEAVKPGANLLRVRVTNLWVNRLIGDEQLPEDSDRNPNGTLKRWPRWLLLGKPSPTGRQTFTSWRLWKKGERLQESGLLGPVVLHTLEVRELGW